MKIKIAIILINLISKTWRIKTTGYQGDFQNGIVVFWHGFMLPVWKYFGKANPTGVVSMSKDGEILSRLLQKWGYSLIRGSSSRRGKEVLEDIISKSFQNLVLMTPDGPQGPRFGMKSGAVVAAARAEVPIYLCGVNISNKYIFENSWDKFQFPLPFSRIALTIAEPVNIEKTTDKDLISRKISELQTKLVLLYSDKQ